MVLGIYFPLSKKNISEHTTNKEWGTSQQLQAECKCSTTALLCSLGKRLQLKVSDPGRSQHGLGSFQALGLFVIQPASLFWILEKYVITQPNMHCYNQGKISGIASWFWFFKKENLLKWWLTCSSDGNRLEQEMSWMHSEEAHGNWEEGINPLGLGSTSTGEWLYSSVSSQQSSSAEERTAGPQIPCSTTCVHRSYEF